MKAPVCLDDSSGGHSLCLWFHVLPSMALLSTGLLIVSAYPIRASLALIFSFILNFPKLFLDLHMHPKMKDLKNKQTKTELPNSGLSSCWLERDQYLLVSLRFDFLLCGTGIVSGPQLSAGVKHSVS